MGGMKSSEIMRCSTCEHIVELHKSYNMRKKPLFLYDQYHISNLFAGKWLSLNQIPLGLWSLP